MSAKLYDNVKIQIGFCGIWCGSCVAGNGSLQELNKRYAKIVDDYDLKDWAPKDFDFEEFRKGLLSLASMPACPGCRQQGGIPDCGIRRCATDKSLEDCSQCGTVRDCLHSELLETMRTGARKADLMVKTKDLDREQLLKKWEKDLEKKWLFSLLFND
jgi:thiol-disulfide isomerase/thioredoxin